MQYIRTEADGQFAFTETVDFLKILSELYGYPDDEYFFLKIIDISRRRYVRNPASQRKSD